jgi:hypothetical protein
MNLSGLSIPVLRTQSSTKRVQMSVGSVGEKRADDAPPIRPTGHTRSADARPNSPRGMASKTIKMTRNATASLYCEET